MTSTTLTYQQAIKIYTAHAQKLQNKLSNMEEEINRFIKGAQKMIEKQDRSQDMAAMKKLEADLN